MFKHVYEDPETGEVVKCHPPDAWRYLSRGWVRIGTEEFQEGKPTEGKPAEGKPAAKKKPTTKKKATKKKGGK